MTKSRQEECELRAAKFVIDWNSEYSSEVLMEKLFIDYVKEHYPNEWKEQMEMMGAL